MRSTRAAVALGCVAATLGAIRTAHAQERYSGPIVGATFSEGPRWGWGAAPAATIGGFGEFIGWRSEFWRYGLLENNSWWEGSHGIVLDVGGFGSADIASLWADPELSAALFVRVELAMRRETDAGVWAFAPSLIPGARVLGVEIAFSATYERWLATLPNHAKKSGIDAQFRLGFDFFELTHVFCHRCQAKVPPTAELNVRHDRTGDGAG